ncbi:MAG: peroxiredoxin [Deltaproteobacteria bacterium]|nr:peroxiredoxin [Deltaproteobacteria bacterium]
MSMIGQKEPAWSAEAYVKGEKKKVSSSDYAGKWHVLYWYPLDFTFICPTEIRGFQEKLDEFEREKVAVIGASTDSFFSHKAWFADRKIFPQEIAHPVLADTNHAVSRAFGVLKEDEGIAFRATVVVDDKGIIRSVAINDLSAGRSPSEVLRTVEALQSGGLCPADWRKGDAFAA